MRSLYRTFGALALAACLIAPPAAATSFSTDQSDLYYIAAESGWGIQLVQRGAIIFATLFVYGPNGTPTWYVATMNSTDGATWTGDLFATTGTYFATVPFNPNIGVTKVGTMTWQPQTTATGLLTYDVNGIPIAKNVTRQTLTFDNYSGTYLGALHGVATGCSDPSNNTAPFDLPLATITVTQSGQAVTLTFSSLGSALFTVTGTLTQDGQFGSITGTYSGFDEIGNAALSELNVQAHSLTGSFSLQSTNIGCRDTGYFAGMRSGS
jgi:hypothetical protein